MAGSTTLYRLDGQFNATLDELENSNDHYFVTGRAGTGKSTLLRLWRRSTRKKLVVLAPTGSAALQIQGQTIHSFFGFPPRMMHPDELKPMRRKKLVRSLEAIIIDEISMVRADMIDQIDLVLRLTRGNDAPFGGIQMVFFGDLFQLPPIVSTVVERTYLEEQYDSPYFFSAGVWNRNVRLIGIELTKIYRQEEEHFLRLLEEIRFENSDQDTLDALNERYQPGTPIPPHTITICARRYLADAINRKRLQELPGTARIFQATISGNFSRSTSPAPPELVLKPGAQVMFVRNDPLRKYVNGTLGEIVAITSESIRVSLADKPGSEVEVEKCIWENIRYKMDKNGDIGSEVTGTFEQYPLNLAWAITIHKSQGMTFRNVCIDMGGGAFDFGQTYVALSRSTHLGGIYLRRPIKSADVQTDQRIVQFYRKLF